MIIFLRWAEKKLKVLTILLLTFCPKSITEEDTAEAIFFFSGRHPGRLINRAIKVLEIGAGLGGLLSPRRRGDDEGGIFTEM